jgi:hypothetical protein
MTTRDEYIARMKLQLDELNAKMAALEAQSSQARDAAYAGYQQHMSKLREESRVTLSKFDELKTAGADSWDRMVGEMEKVRDAFAHAFRDFKSQI